MNNLYEALEVCLEAIDHGMDIETSLARYPDIADELRPIIQVSLNAKGMAAHTPSADVMRRNRAKLLQRAAELREAMVKPSSTRIGFNSIRRLAVTLVVILLVLMSGTGLVRAASTTLPGDNLYQVKRTWEGVTLLFTFDLQRRESLEVEHENERLEELHELIAKGRSAKVDFAGIVTQQNEDKWLVADVPIVISSQTDLHNGLVFVGDAVRVFGVTQSDNSVLAERIEQLPAGAKLPDIGNSGKRAEGESNDSGSVEESFEGIINSITGSLWSINGVTTDVSNAEIKGSPSHGDLVNVEGNFDSAGVFIATKIEVIESDSNSDSGSNDDDNSNSNANENDSSGSGNGNDNGNDSNSGPGGGNDNANNSGSDSGSDSVNDNNSGSGSSDDNSNEDNSGSGGGSDNSNDNGSNSGEGGGDE